MSYLMQNSGSLGADLRSIRKSRGITLIDMSETLGRSIGWMSQVERDISAPSIDESTCYVRRPCCTQLENTHITVI